MINIVPGTRGFEHTMNNESGREAPPESYVSPLNGQTSKHSRAVSTAAQSFAADLDSMFGELDYLI